MIMKKRMVFFQDVEMVEGWPERIRVAQGILTYTIGGVPRDRIRYGEEPGRPRSVADVNCHDCGVIRGQFHVPTCDMECCPGCKGQAFLCGCVPAKELLE
jgi:hypothetical protein